MIAADGTTRRIPFLALATAFLLGQVTWGCLGLPLGLQAAVTAATTVIGWVIGDRRPHRATVLLLIAVSGLGGVRHSLHWEWYESRHLVRLVDDVPRPMTLQGRIVRVDGPFSQNLGAMDARESGLPSPPTVRPSGGIETSEPVVLRYRCWVEAIAVSRGRSWEALGGRVEIWMPSREVPLVGDQWRWTGTARLPPQAGNPRQYCRRTDLARRRLHVQLQVTSVEHAVLETRATTSSAAFFSRWRQAARERMQGAIREPIAGLVSAMVLGRRQDLDPAVEQTFRATGISHVLSISGMHVGLLTVTAAMVIRGLGLGTRVRGVGIAITLCIYIGLSGTAPAVLRAIVGMGTLAWAWWSGRRGSAWDALAVAAVGLSAWDPGNLYDVGAQLSFLGVASLILATDSRVHGDHGRLLACWKSRSPRMIRWCLSGLASITSGIRASLLVTAVTSPLVAHHFHVFSWVAWVLNLWLGPPIALLLVSGLLLAVPWVGEGVSIPLGWASEAAGQLILWAARLLEQRFPPLWIAGPSASGLVVFYALMALLIRRRDWRLTSVFVLSGFWIWLELQNPVGALLSMNNLVSVRPEIAMIDVGHGNATLVRWRDGGVWLIDAGSARGERAAADAIAAVLWDRRIQRIDRLWISHPDRDHFNGVLGLFERFRVGELWIPACFREHPDENWQRMLGEARRRGISLRLVSAGETLQAPPERRYRVLHPPDRRWGETDNASSLVLLLEWEGKRVLLPGDVEGEAVVSLTKQVGKCDLFVAAHHGSLGSDPHRWLHECEPQWVVISAAWRPAWVNARLSDSVAGRAPVEPRFACTDQQGCLTFRWEEGRWRVAGWKSPPD